MITRRTMLAHMAALSVFVSLPKIDGMGGVDNSKPVVLPLMEEIVGQDAVEESVRQDTSEGSSPAVIVESPMGKVRIEDFQSNDPNGLDVIEMIDGFWLRDKYSSSKDQLDYRRLEVVQSTGLPTFRPVQPIYGRPLRATRDLWEEEGFDPHKSVVEWDARTSDEYVRKHQSGKNGNPIGQLDFIRIRLFKSL